MENRLKIVYGIYKNPDDECRAVYDCILSILSILLYNDNIQFIIYENSKEIESEIQKYISYKDISFIKTDNFVSEIDSYCSKRSSSSYLTKGIFYRLQALTEQKRFLYLDTDVICTSKISNLPEYREFKDIIRNKFDTSSVLFSYEGISKNTLLEFIKSNSKYVKKLSFPDESILRDCLSVYERMFEFTYFKHFGRTTLLDRQKWSFEKFLKAYRYLCSLTKDSSIDSKVLESYFRVPREKESGFSTLLKEE